MIRTFAKLSKTDGFQDKSESSKHTSKFSLVRKSPDSAKPKRTVCSSVYKLPESHLSGSQTLFSSDEINLIPCCNERLYFPVNGKMFLTSSKMVFH